MYRFLIQLGFDWYLRFIARAYGAVAFDSEPLLAAVT